MPEDHRVEFSGCDGSTLVGTLSTAYTPGAIGSKNREVQFPTEYRYPSRCVMLLHGGMGHRDYLYHKHLTSMLLAEHGHGPNAVAVFRFDYNGNGDSAGDRFFLSGFWHDIADTQIAMRVLEQEPYRMKTVCLIGHSVGAQHILQLAATGSSSSSSLTSSFSSSSSSSAAAAAAAVAGSVKHSTLDTCRKSLLQRRETWWVPPLLVCVQPRFRLRYWFEEWERQCKSSKDGKWTMRWKSRGRAREHVITRKEVESYANIDMDRVRCINDDSGFGNGRLQILSVHGIVTRGQSSSTSSKIMGYGSDDAAEVAATADGVVPLVDCVEVANRIRCDWHTLKLVSFVFLTAGR